MTGADLIFTPSPHEYRTPDGVLVPNVTSILRAVGVSSDFKHVDEATLAYRAALGIAVHADCHAFDDDDLNWATVDPRVRPYLDAWAAFRADKHLTPVQRERRVFHQTFGYCGTLDGIFEQPGCERVLVDIKIGDPDAAAAHLQTAAYDAAYRVEFSDQPVGARWSVQLQPGLKVPYRICEYRDFRDFQKFVACVTTFNEQPARRRRIR